MQYTLRNVPQELDKALREKATVEGKSLNEAVIDTLVDALSLRNPTAAKRDLSDVWGKSPADPELDTALAEAREIDWEEWK